jgi:exodeoxyribonuclease V alpha subunit
MQSKVFTQPSTLEKLSGIVKRITFHSPETGWTVLKINPFDKPLLEIAVTIHQSKVFAGATMDFYGNWTHHPKFGEQFKAVKAVELKPASANALEKYLGSGLIKGIGPAFAKRIVDHFGKDTLDVFDTHIEKLDEVPGIAKKKLDMIALAWVEHKDIKDVMMFLQSYDISTLFAVKIYKTYGKESISIVSENPYRLAKDIFGIGFFSADKVALNMKLGEASEQRITAAIDHVLAGSREEGHCYLTREQIVKQVNELLQNSLDVQILTLLKNLEQAEAIKVRVLSAPNAKEDQQVKGYYSPSIYFDEEYIGKKVKQLGKKTIPQDEARIKIWIGKYCAKYTISLSDEQEQSVVGVVRQGFSILTGGPGCGKTTTTRVLVALLSAMKKKVLLAAPTGRASQRMTEVIGMQAKTIHRLLEWQPAKGGFKKTDKDPLKADFLIIDECSMLDVNLAAALLRAVSQNTQVLFIGDADQLPSVGAGNIFKDIIASRAVPVFRLTRIFRQAKESSIIRFAHEINQGITPVIESPFHKPLAWTEKLDCLFIDSDEATQEQLHFIKRVKTQAVKHTGVSQHEEIKQTEAENNMRNTDSDFYTKENVFTIPEKFAHVDIEKLLETQTYVEELKQVLKKVHPWSTLNFGLNATDTVKKVYSETIPKYFGKEVEIQILTPMTRGSLGTMSLNRLIQETINPPRLETAQIQLGDRIFRVGDRIIQKRNNYDLNVFNGDIGRILSINNEDMKISVEYKSGQEVRAVTYEKEALAEIDFAYAITIHKSQGSEFQAVIIPITTQHFNMLFRNLLYTGLTRAKKLAVFIGSRKALAMAVKNNKTFVRQTALQQLLA